MQQVFHPHTAALIARDVSTMRPSCSITVRSPWPSAWRIRWVTIIVVRESLRMMRSVNAMTKAAVLGSSAAVCSSSSRIFHRIDGRHDQTDRLPLSAGEQSHPVIQPLVEPQSELRNPPPELLLPLPVDRLAQAAPLPLELANARFSCSVRFSQLPAIGSWKTRATSAERRAVDQPVTSLSSISTRPESLRVSPAIRFKALTCRRRCCRSR